MEKRKRSGEKIRQNYGLKADENDGDDNDGDKDVTKDDSNPFRCSEPTRGRESGAEVAVGVLVGAVLACLPVAIAVVVMGVRTCMRIRAAKRGRAEESEKESTEGEGGTGTGRPLLPGQGKRRACLWFPGV